MTASPPFDRSDLEDAIFAWAQAATGLADDKIRWAWQRSPSPAPPFVTLALLDEGATVLWERRHLDPVGDDLAVLHTAQGQVTLSINAYGDSNAPDTDARALMDRLTSALRTDEGLALLADEGVTVINVGRARSLDFLLDTDPRSRVQCDVTLGVVHNVTETVTTIGEVEVTNEEVGFDPLTIVVPEE